MCWLCEREIEVNSDVIHFAASKSVVADPKIVNRTENIQEKFWDALLATINSNDFISLKEVIGCPDCADRGVEWIEITGTEVNYKITFEYFNEPEIIQEMVSLLRTYQDAFEVEDELQLIFNEVVLINQLGKINDMLNVNASHSNLIELPNLTYYFDDQLPQNIRVNGANINFHGVLKKDSTEVFRTSSTVVDFEARNSRVF